MSAVKLIRDGRLFLKRVAASAQSPELAWRWPLENRPLILPRQMIRDRLQHVAQQAGYAGGFEVTGD